MLDSRRLRERFFSFVLLRSSLVTSIILLSLGVCLAKQSGQSTKVNKSFGDALVGSWTLNTSKSSNTSLESKSIAIESQENGYKLTIDYVQANGVRWHFSATTSMKADVVKTYDNDGKQTNQDWRVTRNGPDSFLLEWLGPYGMQQKYDVTADGKTMTMHDATVSPKIIGGKTDKGGKLVRVDHTEVFDRVVINPAK